MGQLDDAIREHLELKRRRGADATEIARQEREALGPVRTPIEGTPPPAGENGGTQAEAEPYPPAALTDDAGGAPVPVEGLEQAPPGDAETLLHPAATPEEEPWPEEAVAPPEPIPGQESFGEPAEHAPAAEPPAADPGMGQVGPETVEYDVEAGHYQEAADAASSYPPQAPAPAPPPPPAPAEPPASQTPPPAAAPATPHPAEPPPPPAHVEPESADEPPAEAGGEQPPHPPPPPGDAEHEEGEGEDVLEETPEFLQETPEHDRLWFEQRPPRDFDFDK
ncbi:MAG: hypothetical protein E6G56_12115 [Actinobacteria bacterium]|nr:MAG: hypothetical protein E6G56_12115 [Actinomycetota bacterium]